MSLSNNSSTEYKQISFGCCCKLNHIYQTTVTRLTVLPEKSQNIWNLILAFPSPKNKKETKTYLFSDPSHFPFFFSGKYLKFLDFTGFCDTSGLYSLVAGQEIGQTCSKRSVTRVQTLDCCCFCSLWIFCSCSNTELHDAPTFTSIIFFFSQLGVGIIAFLRHQNVLLMLTTN